MGSCLTTLRGRMESRREEQQQHLDEPFMEAHTLYRELLRQSQVKSQPLRNNIGPFQSEMPLTMGQWMSMQDAFWETRHQQWVGLGGMMEWEAVQEAVAAVRCGNLEMAQKIIEEHDLTTPLGNLSESYDLLGNVYKVPLYCLLRPVNLIREDSEPSEQLLNEKSPSPCKTDRPLKIRICGTGEDVELRVSARDNLATGKMKLWRKTGYPGRQRWVYGGKVFGEKDVLTCRVPQGHIVQVLFVDAQSDAAAAAAAAASPCACAPSPNI